MKYKLRLNVDITECDDNGYANGNMNRLQVMEELPFDAGSFLEIAHILGRFHELGADIRKHQSLAAAS